MNEQIQKLADQAEQYAVSDNASMLFDVWKKRYTEKFAELIIQNCVAEIAMIGVSNFDNSDIMWTVEKAIENIETRFGLK